MKKILAAALCLMLSAASCAGTRIVPQAHYDDAPSTAIIIPPSDKNPPNGTIDPGLKPEEVRKTVEETVSTAAGCAFMSLDDGFMYQAYNLHEQTAPASLTKLLTACTALKYVSPDELMTVDTEVYLVQPNSSLAYLSIGQQMTLNDLLKGMLLSSGNDAAYSVAVNCARLIETTVPMTDYEAAQYFCYKMNEVAAEIGMTESYFVNPDGWDDSSQYTTISDLLILAEHALENENIRNITSSAEDTVYFATGGSKTWENSNRLLHADDEYYCPYATGVKTGSTINAGYCLISCFEKDDKRYISAVTGCDSDEDRYASTLELFEKYVK